MTKPTSRAPRVRFLALLALLAPFLPAIFAGCGESEDDLGPECDPDPCSGDQICVDYKTDMSTGTQCVATTCDDCECALAEHCDSGGATCKEVEYGLRLSNCFWSPV